MHDNGLVWASAPDKALTWMNALAGGVPVVSRDGYPVEINALWYNAVCYALGGFPFRRGGVRRRVESVARVDSERFPGDVLERRRRVSGRFRRS